MTAFVLDQGNSFYVWVAGSIATPNGTSVLGHTGGATGAWVRASDGSEGSTIFPRTPGTDMAPIINAALLAGNVALAPGDFEISSAILVPSDTVLAGAGDGSSFLVPLAWPGTLPDDPSNAMVKILGTVVTADTPTVTVDAIADSFSVTVTSDAVFTADGWAFIQAFGGASQYPETNGTAVEESSLVQVASKLANVLTLKSPTNVRHNLGATCKRATPVERATVRGITIKGTGGIVATGVYVNFTSNASVDVGVESFSHSGVCVLHSVDAKVSVHSYGDINSAIFQAAAHHSDLSVRCEPSGNRGNALSTSRRGLITLRWMCRSTLIHDFELRNGFTGIQMWGGIDTTIHRGLIQNMAVYERGLIGEGAAALATQGGLGAGIEVNAYPNVPVNGEFTFTPSFENIRLVDCRGFWNGGYPVPGGTEWSGFIEDCHNLALRGVSFINDGLVNPTGANTDWRTGLHLLDAFGEVAIDTQMVGVEIARHSIGASYDWATTMVIDGSNGSTTSSIGLTIDSNDPSVGLSCAKMLVGNYANPFLFANLVPAGAARVRIEKLSYIFDYSDVILGVNNTGESLGFGAVVQIGNLINYVAGIDHTTITRIPAKAVVVQNSTNGNFCLMALIGSGSQTALCTGAVVTGDLLEMHAVNHTLVTNNASTDPVAIALSSGTDTYIQIGPP
jgi:hypothetical protein